MYTNPVHGRLLILITIESRNAPGPFPGNIQQYILCFYIFYWYFLLLHEHVTVISHRVKSIIQFSFICIPVQYFFMLSAHIIFDSYKIYCMKKTAH